MTKTSPNRAWILLCACTSLWAGCGDDKSKGPARLALEFPAIAHDSQIRFPTDMKFLPDGSGDFITVERDGRVEYMRLAGDQATVVGGFQIPDVYVMNAAGLVGVAIDPDYATNRFVYVALTVESTRSVIRRYTLDLDDIDGTLASAVEILDASNADGRLVHNITSLGFEPDGTMWATAGEKDVSEEAQNPETTLGALLRFAPSRQPGVGGFEPVAPGSGLGDNAHEAVYAIGLRSPWKAVHHQDAWYVGDVGAAAVEEINIIREPGSNFGWPLAEGPCMTGCGGLVEPWMSYGHSSSESWVIDDLEALPTVRRSVYVGWIYQPSDSDPYKGRWNDVLVFGDIFVGFVRARTLDGDGPSWHAGHISLVTTWAQAPDGYVYLWSMGGEPDMTENPTTAVLHRAVLAKPE